MEKPHEYRMKCNVCGQIFCYTDKDLSLNNTNQKLASLYSFQSITTRSSYHKYEKAKRADSIMSRTTDYTRCPNCHSTDLINIVDMSMSCDEVFDMNGREDYYPGASRDRGRRKKVVKKIELEICFDNGFAPPEIFRGDTSTSENPCSYCPFFAWDDEIGEGECVLSVSTESEGGRCPIKKFFN